jgi:hypothetical protein
MSLRDGEWDTLLACFPRAELEWRADGSGLVLLPKLHLEAGWSANSTDTWFVIPVGYPAAMPDCFWVEPNITLAAGVAPANSGVQPIGGSGPVGLWFSWHLQSWTPGSDDLITYVRFIESRLRNAT